MGFFFSENRSFDGLSKLMSDAKSIDFKEQVLIFHKSSDPVLTDWSLREIQSYVVVGLF